MPKGTGNWPNRLVLTSSDRLESSDQTENQHSGNQSPKVYRSKSARRIDKVIRAPRGL